MPEYRRSYVPGGAFFFTLVTHDRTHRRLRARPDHLRGPGLFVRSPGPGPPGADFSRRYRGPALWENPASTARL